MTGHERLDKILKTIEEGKTVYFTTLCRNVPVKRTTLEAFRKRGYEFFKSTDADVLMMQGRKYVSTSEYRITSK